MGKCLAILICVIWATICQSLQLHFLTRSAALAKWPRMIVPVAWRIESKWKWCPRRSSAEGRLRTFGAPRSAPSPGEVLGQCWPARTTGTRRSHCSVPPDVNSGGSRMEQRSWPIRLVQRGASTPRIQEYYDISEDVVYLLGRLKCILDFCWKISYQCRTMLNIRQYLFMNKFLNLSNFKNNFWKNLFTLKASVKCTYVCVKIKIYKKTPSILHRPKKLSTFQADANEI